MSDERKQWLTEQDEPESETADVEAHKHLREAAGEGEDESSADVEAHKHLRPKFEK